MDLSIVPHAEGLWTVQRGGVPVDGLVGVPHEAALAGVTDLLNEAASMAAEMQVDSEVGLLPEEWEIPVLAETAATGPHRTFEQVTWSALDPANGIVPLWICTSQEGGGHLGARLAGYFTDLQVGPTPSGRGRFYDSDAGEEARDLILGDRTFGISADPTEEVTYDVECLEMDPDGMYCVEDRISFLTYEIGGATMTPAPGFHNAHIRLASSAPAAGPEPGAPADGSTPAPVMSSGPAARMAEVGAHLTAGLTHVDEEPCCDACTTRDARRAVTAGVSYGMSRRRAVIAGGVEVPVTPPRAWFTDPGFDGPAPLTIVDAGPDAGRFYGHLALWDECHTGSPEGACLTTPRSNTNYAYFLTGYLVCDDGSEVAVGRYTLGGGHADDRLSFAGAAEHYDNAGAGIAEITVGEDAHGIWAAGALTPGVTPEQIRLARATSPSGDWRWIGRGYEFVAALAVNQPGFAVARVASGRPVALVAAGAQRLARINHDAGDDRYDRLERQVSELRAIATAPARAALGTIQRERLLARLRG